MIMNRQEILRRFQEMEEKITHHSVYTIAKEKFLNWAEQSSINGIPNITRTESLMIKLIWAIFFLCSASYCAFGVSRSFMLFLQHEVNTISTTERYNSIQFPTITFCNRNPYKLNIDNGLVRKFKAARNKTLTTVRDKNSSRFDRMFIIDYVNKYTIESLNFTERERKLISYNIDDMLISASFNNLALSKNEFVEVNTNSYGTCYKFNSGRNVSGHKLDLKSSTNPGKKNALKLELYLGDSYLSNDLVKSIGAVVFVHNSSIVPLMEIEGVSLPAGFESDIVIDQDFYMKLGTPHSNCIQDVRSPDSFDSFLYKVTVKLLGKYRQKHCLQFCYQKSLIEQCKCFDINTPIYAYNESIPCNLEEAKSCAFNALNNFYDLNANHSCFEDCPLECESIYYNLVTYQSVFPSPFYADYLIKYDRPAYRSVRNLTSFAQIKRSVLALNIYFSDISYSYTFEVPMKTIEQLIADIGGLMGICIGTSLLGFVEIIELILDLLFFTDYSVAKGNKIHVRSAFAKDLKF